MEHLKKLTFKLLFPHIAILILLVPVASALLIYAFLYPDSNPTAVYGAYFLSAYTLTILCARMPQFFKKIKKIKENNKYVNRYITDAHLRVKISLYGTVALNTVYALMQLISGFHFHSVWFYALAVYYTSLAVMRFFLLRDTRRAVPGVNIKRELTIYRFCGILLLVMNQALAIIVFYIVRQNRGFEYHYIQTIAMAVYTFTAMTIAVINIFKYRRYESPVMSAAKAISLASATVSMLSLETAMLSAFDNSNNPDFRQNITAATGAVVCTFVLGMAVYMIVHSNIELKNIERNKIK